MELGLSHLVGIFDRIGIVAFALSGVEVGARRRLDLFGLLVMGIVTATGGGFMRDVAIGRIPLVLDRPDYLIWAAASSAIAIALVWRGYSIPKWIVATADAAGLGAFAAAGALAAIAADLPLPAVIVLAMLTGTGGGLIRDLLADRVPLVLRSEINATAAGLGGLTVYTLDPIHTGAAALSGLSVAALVRVAGIAFNLHLPIPNHHEPTPPD